MSQQKPAQPPIKMLPPPPRFLPGDGPNLKNEDFQNPTILGQGSFGKVYKARHRKTNRDYAIKVISKPKIINLKMERQLENEIDIMGRVNHPNIVSMDTYFESPENIYLVMELGGAHLYEKLKSMKTFPEELAAKFFWEATSAVAYLHSLSPPIIHRDIKPENLLVCPGNVLKMADFGWSNMKQAGKNNTYCGTPDYLAPEMVNEEGHTEKLDIWTLGVLLFELLTGNAPFTPVNLKNRHEKMKQLEMNIVSLNYRIPPQVASEPRNIIQAILQRDPSKRPSAEDILKHSWFKKFNFYPKEQLSQKTLQKSQTASPAQLNMNDLPSGTSPRIITPQNAQKIQLTKQFSYQDDSESRRVNNQQNHNASSQQNQIPGQMCTKIATNPYAQPIKIIGSREVTPDKQYIHYKATNLNTSSQNISRDISPNRLVAPSLNSYNIPNVKKTVAKPMGSSPGQSSSHNIIKPPLSGPISSAGYSTQQKIFSQTQNLNLNQTGSSNNLPQQMYQTQPLNYQNSSTHDNDISNIPSSNNNIYSKYGITRQRSNSPSPLQGAHSINQISNNFIKKPPGGINTNINSYSNQYSQQQPSSNSPVPQSNTYQNQNQNYTYASRDNNISNKDILNDPSKSYNMAVAGNTPQQAQLTQAPSNAHQAGTYRNKNQLYFSDYNNNFQVSTDNFPKQPQNMMNQIQSEDTQKQRPFIQHGHTPSTVSNTNTNTINTNQSNTPSITQYINEININQDPQEGNSTINSQRQKGISSNKLPQQAGDYENEDIELLKENIRSEKIKSSTLSSQNEKQKLEIDFLKNSLNQAIGNKVQTQKGQVVTQSDYDKLKENMIELQKVNAEQERQLKKLISEKERYKSQKEEHGNMLKEKQQIEKKLGVIYENVKEFLPYLEKLDSNWQLSETGQTLSALKQTKRMLDSFLQTKQSGGSNQGIATAQLAKQLKESESINYNLVNRNQQLRGTLDIYCDQFMELDQQLLDIKGRESELTEYDISQLLRNLVQFQTCINAMHQSPNYQGMMQSPKIPKYGH